MSHANQRASAFGAAAPLTGHTAVSYYTHLGITGEA